MDPLPSTSPLVLGKVANFLLSGLRASEARYRSSLADFSNELALRGIAWEELDEAQLDSTVAEHIVDLYENSAEGEGISEGAVLVSALQKVLPRFRLTTAWKALDIWRVRHPPTQAPAFPPEVALALAVWMLLANQPACATCTLLCFVGLFRASEMIRLTFSELYLSTAQAVFVLGVTKRGMEQKVVITNTSVILWLHRYLKWRLQSVSAEPTSRVFDISYGKFSYWIQKGMAALEFPGHWTSHGLRRGGATELFRMNVPLPSIALHGRWLSERSMREYLRKGEVTLLRLRGAVAKSSWTRASSLSKLGLAAWDVPVGFAGGGGKQ
jgi:integrase